MRSRKKERKKSLTLLRSGFWLLFWITVGLWLGEAGAEAKNTATVDKEGNIIFHTTDTKATSGIHWTTVGYTIRRNPTRGNPLADHNYATIWLDDAWKSKKDNGDGTYTILFTIPKKVVDKAMLDAGILDEGEEDTIYLNGIFKVVINGVLGKATYRTLEGIKKAQRWNNTKDFDDRFDVKLPFQMAAFPVYVRYITNDQTLIEEKQQKEKVKSGKTTTVTLAEKKKFAGKSYEIYRSYYAYLTRPGKKLEDRKLRKGDSLASVKKRSAKMKSGGIVFTAVMKTPKEPDAVPNETKDQMEGGLPDQLGGEVILEADTRGAESFSAREGIPGSESLYINGFCPEYLRTYQWKRCFGTKYYDVTVSRTYRLYWTEMSTQINPETGEEESRPEEKSASRFVTKNYRIRRDFSYWTIEQLDLYVPEQLVVENGALPSKKAEIKAAVPRIPMLSYEIHGKEKAHLIEPGDSRFMTLPETAVHGGNSCPSVPLEDFRPFAEAHMGQIRVRNDKLVWDGKQIMDGSYQEISGKTPKEIPESEQETGSDVFYQHGYCVPADLTNGIYASKGVFRYQRSLHAGELAADKKETLVYPAEEINDVTVHTPAVCYAQLEDKFADCQMINPDMSRCALVLGLPFRLSFPATGQHRNILGYGYRDYRKYLKKREVCFPFDVVYRGQTVRKETWVEVEEENQFYLPTHVDEGKYEVKMRALARNASEGSEAEEDSANLALEHDTAVTAVPVEVSGRIYGLSVYDISDYPLWRPVFRKENSLVPSGFCFPVSKFPFQKGSHPLFANRGYWKAGYTVRMSLLTSGNMEGAEDAVVIHPTFFWYDKDKKNRREVDVYYSETVDNQYYRFVKIGSHTDRSHWKTIKCGNPYLSIPNREITETAARKKLSEKEVREREHKIYCYDEILLPSASQMLLQPVGMQKWYFEYGLPSKIYIVEKGFDLEKKLTEEPVSGKEAYFLKQGTLCLNVEIETIEQGRRHLSYINAQQENAGYCNMWKKEGFIYGQGFAEGDLALIAGDESAAHDYQTRGTH